MVKIFCNCFFVPATDVTEYTLLEGQGRLFYIASREAPSECYRASCGFLLTLPSALFTRPLFSVGPRC